jgi:lipopolysaccharide/colanic/teichoic acid biosynthesis glycosyltransferase
MKRAFDLVLTVLSAPLWLPVAIVVAVAVRIQLGRPILFRQKRPGLGGAPFEMVKFRTMIEARDDNGTPLTDAQRLTPFGRVLRETSLDELPELWNVIRGDMSLVGPRPLLMDYLSLYSPEQARRHEVRPGISGWAQVNGRNAVDWEERLALDVWYVRNRSMWLDMRILARTFHRVLKRDGITASGEATMKKFTGTAP